jgi:hypothetical protein
MDDFSKFMNRFDVDNERTLLTRATGADFGRRWAIAATKGAITRWQIEASGYGSFVHMWAGVKLWILYERSSPGDFMFDADLEERMDIPCVPLLLLPGDQL